MPLVYDLNGTVYRRAEKSFIGYDGDGNVDCVYSFPWPDWAVKTVNTLIREGYKMDSAIARVEKQLHDEMMAAHG